MKIWIEEPTKRLLLLSLFALTCGCRTPKYQLPPPLPEGDAEVVSTPVESKTPASAAAIAEPPLAEVSDRAGLPVQGYLVVPDGLASGDRSVSNVPKVREHLSDSDGPGARTQLVATQGSIAGGVAASSADEESLILPFDQQIAAEQAGSVVDGAAMPSQSDVMAAKGSLPPLGIALTVTGVHPGMGPVKVALFQTAEGFPKPEHASQIIEIKADGSKVTSDLSAAGRVVVAVYQDINRDGKLTRNLIGVPVEPFAFTRERGEWAPGELRGPPSFEQAAITVSEAGQNVVISLPGA